MPRILALFAIFILGCSSTVYGVTGAPGAGAGGEAAATTGGSAGSVVATGGQSGATSSAGAPSTGGQGAAGGGAGGSAGAPAGSTYVDVVPGVTTTCVFPSYIVLAPLVPDACQSYRLSDLCMKCAGDCTLPFTFTNFVWDYSSLTLTFDVHNNNELFTMEQGSCTTGTQPCTYKVYESVPSFDVFTMRIVFSLTDRGYVPSSFGDEPTVAPGSTSCSANGTAELNETSSCVRAGWDDYWRSLTIPCAK